MVVQSAPPEDFVLALESLKGQSFRSEFRVLQIPPPTHIAPWCVALQGEVLSPSSHGSPQRLGDSKFVLLHDPAGHETWDGTFRIVVNARAPMDSQMGDDPLLGEVAWTWLTDNLGAHGAQYHKLTGTVTRVFNESFSGSDLQSQSVDLELRASWSPPSPYLTEHLLAWADFCAQLAGLDPHSPSVATLPRKSVSS